MYQIKKELKKRENRPLLAILGLATLIYLIGLNWGLPNTISWQSDTLAPMRPLKGMFSLYSFGYFHKYPYVHSFILSILNAPIIVIYGVYYILSGGSFSPALFSEAIQGSKILATTLILEDRLIGVVMALGLIFNVFLMGRKLFGRQAGFFAALVVVLNQGINHLAHVAKVEVPYLFWGTLSIYALIWAIETRERKFYIYTAIFSGLCYGSKDQGYAFFVLPFLMILILVPLFKDLKNKKVNSKYWKGAFLWFSIAFGGTFIIVENLILNWSGFLLRIGHLTGDAGFRSAAYPETIIGNLGMLLDTFMELNALVSPVVVVFIFVGLVLLVKEKKISFSYTLPLLVCFSFYLTFLLIVRQTMPRFIVSISIFLAPYAGLGAAKLYKKAKVLTTIILIVPLLNTLLINFSLLSDPRYEMEKYMKQVMEEGDVIEYYSFQQYLPRFAEGTKSSVVKSPPQNFYNLEERHPDYIILTSKWYTRYITKPNIKNSSLRYSVVEKMRRYEEQGYSQYFTDLIEGKRGYHVIKRVSAHSLTQGWLSLKIPDHLILLKKD
ncbi:MAG: hypothetical protein B6229_00550 [Spirochaetaceae bacterium 4572_7]|nr:MAG: hypothetical protein B6229_00550 [Spirochaetaceae bacterium 4572_7]